MINIKKLSFKESVALYNSLLFSRHILNYNKVLSLGLGTVLLLYFVKVISKNYSVDVQKKRNLIK